MYFTVLARPDLPRDALLLPHEGAGARAAVAGHLEHRGGADVRHHHRLLEGDVDVLALAGPLAGEEREGDADRSLDPAVVVRHRERAADRRAVGIACGVEVAAHGCHGEVGAAPARARPRLAEGRERDVDQARVAGAKLRPAEAGRGPGLEHHVGAGGEPEEELAAARTGEV